MNEPFENVPEVSFAERDPVQISEAILRGFELAWFQDTGERLTLYRPDARRMFLLYVAGIVMQQRQAINYAGRMNLLKYMEHEYLDGWGGNWGNRGSRLTASSALTTVRFSVSIPINTSVTIPVGTLVATSGVSVTITFETTALGTIPIGQSSVDVPARSTQPGIIGNDLLPGQIDRLINLNVPFTVSATNTTTSLGGAETQTDEEYRFMLWNLPESLSTAGPREKYDWWARRANPAISDVAVHSAPEIAGEVHIYPLLADGVIPSDEILAQVLAICSADKIRPLTDYVFVERPVEVPFDIDLDYYVYQADLTILTSIQTAVIAAVDEFVAWTKSRIGRDVIPSELHRRILNAGAKRIVIRTPDYRASVYNELARARNVTVNFGGIESIFHQELLP